MECCEGIGDLSDYMSTVDVFQSNPTPTYTPAYTPPYTSGQSSWGNPWSAISTAISSASGILGARYAVPQLNPGQLIQTGPSGQSLMYQGTAGNMSLPSLTSLTSSLGGSSLPLLLIGGVVLFMMMKK